MPCLSRRPDSVLNDSIRVSNAESQLALPLRITTCFDSSAISSPKGSAAWVGGGGGGVGVWAVDGTSAGDLVSAGGGAGAAGAVGGTGVVAGVGVGAGDCANAGRIVD